MSNDSSKWVLDKLKEIEGAEEAQRVRIRVLGSDQKTRASGVVRFPLSAGGITKATDVADVAQPGNIIRVELLSETGQYVRGMSRTLEPLTLHDPMGDLARNIADNLGHGNATRGSEAQERASVQSEALPMLAMERMTRSLSEALVRLDASSRMREENLMNLANQSVTALRAVAMGRTAGDAEVWKMLVEAKETAGVLAGEANARDDMEERKGPETSPTEALTAVKGIIDGVSQLGGLKDDAASGKLLTKLVKELAAGRGHKALAKAVKGLSAEERQKLAAQLLPLLAS